MNDSKREIQLIEQSRYQEWALSKDDAQLDHPIPISVCSMQIPNQT